MNSDVDNGNHETVLIVDDTPANLQVLLEALEGVGFEVLVATNGRQAVQRAELGKPDLILLDVLMPGIDGFETCRLLKSHDALRDIPVIFMTASSETREKLAGFAAGGVDYIIKPLDHDEVLARIRNHLQIRTLQRTLEAQNQQLQAITEALTRFLQTGRHQEASALLLKSTVWQTQSQYGLMGVVIDGNRPGMPVVRVLNTVSEGRDTPLELEQRFFEPMCSTIDRLGYADYSVAELETHIGPVISQRRMVLQANTNGSFDNSLACNSFSFLSAPIQQDDGVSGVLTVARPSKCYGDIENSAIDRLARAAGVIYECERIKQRQAESEKRWLRAEEKVGYFQEEIKTRHNFDDIVGGSRALQQVLNQLERVAKTDSTVLIRGETGTGKELIARAIHNLSPRKRLPLIRVNCAALPESLVESELFGHEKGAFTGATGQRKGRFELADGGTLFLDEIGDMPVAAQTKLLRVLQEQEFERVGGSDTIHVDVRMIAATHRDLRALVAENRFREDLYYRLNVFPIEIPPLRQRREDIAPLVKFFVNRFAVKLGIRIERIAECTLQRLCTYSWPGNIRELENVIERAIILTSGDVLEVPASILPAVPDHDPLFTEAGAPEPRTGFLLPERAHDWRTPTAFSGTLDDVQRRYILQVLESTGWVIEGKQGAAVILGINPSTLRNRMRKLGIRRLEPSN